ncbi:MAG TPA: NAD(P)H-dependent oxidoreductase, partial [Micropruina sp.]|nr:NAD(P)H-dependent oxidoreductase [Micropruina sp.]
LLVKYLTNNGEAMNVLVLVGSTRAASYNARMAEAVVAALPAHVAVSRFDLTTLPFYDADADAAGELGEVVDVFRRGVAAADAIVIATPVYNGSMSASVKNAIDTASRPRPGASISGVPVGVVTAASNARAAGVLEHVRLSLRIAGAAPLGRGLVALLGESFDAQGDLVPELRDELAGFVSELLAAADSADAGDQAPAA